MAFKVAIFGPGFFIATYPVFSQGEPGFAAPSVGSGLYPRAVAACTISLRFGWRTARDWGIFLPWPRVLVLSMFEGQMIRKPGRFRTFQP